MQTGTITVFSGAGLPLEIQNHLLPPLKPGEILIKNKYTTLCGSDIHTYCGIRQETTPTVLGHEIVGELVDIHPEHPGVDDNGHPLAKGDILTWSIFSSDPASLFSLEGIPQKGNHLFKYGHAKVTEQDPFHGGLSEYCILKKNTGILKIPADIPLPIAATLNCAIATVAASIRLAGNLEGKNVLIFGMGLLGINCVAMCKEAGAAWIGAADISESRLNHAAGFGATELINIQENTAQITSTLQEKFVKKGVDVVFDMSGSPKAMEMGMDVLGIGGCAVWIGAVFKNRKIQLDAERIIRNLHTIKGIHNYNFEDFRYALDFLKDNFKKYPFDTIVEKEFDLKDAEQAFKYAVEHKPLRVGIKI